MHKLCQTPAEAPADRIHLQLGRCRVDFVLMQATQSAQLMQQAALAGFPLSPAQAAQMAQQAQQANFLAHQAFAQQQAAAAGAFFAQACSPAAG